MQEIPLSEVDDETEFQRGEIFRVYGNFYNAPKEENYYDYMLVDNHGTFLAINVSKHPAGLAKAGIILSEFDTIKEVGRIVVSAKSVKDYVGDNSTFWLKVT